MRSYLGIDNGVTGTIGVITDKAWLFQTPIKKEQSYTKKKAIISRIDIFALKEILRKYGDAFLLLERPFVNPGMFKSTLSAIRALEATLNVIEMLNIPYAYIDSKEWQKAMLPQGIKGSPELKKASMDVGCRLFPEYREQIEKHGDADGLLIAEYCRRTYK